MKLEDFGDKHLQIIIGKLISEDVSKKWLKGILLQKKFSVGHHSRDLSLAEFFDRFIWDNLSEEQQKKVVESLNLIIEEDLFKPVEFGSYYQDLIDMACMMGKKLPGSINSNLLLKWKKEGFPNLVKPKNYSSSLQAEFTQKIDNAFGKN